VIEAVVDCALWCPAQELGFRFFGAFKVSSCSIEAFHLAQWTIGAHITNLIVVVADLTIYNIITAR